MSGDSWMYPYQRTPMGNPYISHIVGIYGLQSPKIPREHNKYHGYTVRGTSNCPLNMSSIHNSECLCFYGYQLFGDNAQSPETQCLPVIFRWGKTGILCCSSLIWSNYSDLTRPHPKRQLRKGNPLISGKSRMVKYYNLPRLMLLYPWTCLRTAMAGPILVVPRQKEIHREMICIV